MVATVRNKRNTAITVCGHIIPPNTSKVLYDLPDGFKCNSDIISIEVIEDKPKKPKKETVKTLTEEGTTQRKRGRKPKEKEILIESDGDVNA